MKKIILASGSPRRKTLLEWAEISFEVVVPDIDESYDESLAVADVPVFIARNKAHAVSGMEDNIIIAADTVVVLNGEVIGKPLDEPEAFAILKKLSGKVHQVITGVVILYDKKEIAFADVTEVAFHELSDDQIRYYIEKYKPYDKAGAYAIQEWIGVVGIKHIEGDFYNVMGLPISRVVKALQQIS